MQLCDSKILLVDDEPLLLAIFGQWLMGNNRHRITVAADGQEALELLAKSTYDLVITDVNMPRVSGIELVRQMGKSKMRAPSIVFVSGFGNVDEREMYGLGVQAFVTKPTDRQTFLGVAERAVADRTELWRVPLEESPRHSLHLDAVDFSDTAPNTGIAVGRGGFSAPYARTAALGKVNFDCYLPARDTRLSGQGYVRWISPAEGRIGVEFAHLEDNCRTAVLEEMNKQHSQAFIPCR